VVCLGGDFCVWRRMSTNSAQFRPIIFQPRRIS